MANTWRLSAGNEGHVILSSWNSANNEKWYVRLGDKALTNEPLPLDGAVSVAEHYVKKSGASILSDATATWRNAKPSTAQVQLAQRLKIDIGQMTKGELSSAIDSVMSEAATAKQIRYAKYLGHPNPEICTKRELMAWIGTHKNGIRPPAPR